MSKRRRRIGLLSVAALASGLVASLVTGTAATAATADTADTADTMPSATADRTMPHFEIGVPGEDIGDQVDAGAVEVRYSGGTTKSLVAPNPEAGDRFGAAITSYDYDADGRQDLYVGAPGRDVTGKVDAGAVFVYHGTPNGLVYAEIITLDSPGVPGQTQAGAEFGASVFHDPYQQNGNGGELNMFVQIGAPGYDVDGAADAGALLDLNVRRPRYSYLDTESDWPGGQSEAGDRFGTAITENDSVRTISAPGKDIDGQADAGAVYFQTMANTGVRAVIHQNSPGMPGAAEAGDRFGAALTQSWERIYIGVPGEDMGEQPDAGMVSSIVDNGWEEQPDPGPTFHQNSEDDVTGEPLTGAAEAGDRFGATLAVHQLVGDWDDPTAHLFVGAPGEDLADKENAGMVNVLHDPDRRALTDARLGGTNEPGDRFGAALYARMMDLPSIAVGIPGENSRSGVVKVVLPESRNWWQITGAREAGDQYGAAIGGSL